MRPILSYRTVLFATLSRLQTYAFAPICSSTSIRAGNVSSLPLLTRTSVMEHKNDSKISKVTLCRHMSFFDPGDLSIAQVDKDGMTEIFEDLDNGGRDGTGYVVIDVRGNDEVAYTGKISSHVHTIPLPLIAQMGVFNMEEEDFKEAFGFQKPQPDETIVFTCKAGMRSMQAAQLASMSGYSNLVNYSGGADEWFRR